MTIEIRGTHLLMLLAGAGLATAAIAAGAASDHQIHACVAKKSGAVKIKAHCGRGDRKVAWNVRGPVGARGPTGAIGPRGATGPAGTNGTNGTNGAKGDVGNGILLRDANDAVVGHVTGVSSGFSPARPGWAVITTKGYVLSTTVTDQGVIVASPFFFSGMNCTGTPYLSSFINGSTAFAKTLYATASGKLRTLVGADANGTATAVTQSIQSTSDATGACTNGNNSVSAWTATDISAADAGLPATITAPLHMV